MPTEGWYQDPDDTNYNRWWDGQQWTERTSPATEAAPVFPDDQATAEQDDYSEPMFGLDRIRDMSSRELILAAIVVILIIVVLFVRVF